MARAKRKTLNRSRIDLERQQRLEQPDVPGATGRRGGVSPQAAEIKARKRRGKTEKHTSDDTPTR